MLHQFIYLIISFTTGSPTFNFRMHFLHYYSALLCLLASMSLALSPQASHVLDQIATISKSLRANQDAVNNYNGGLIGAFPLAGEFYDTWTSLRAANAHVPRNTTFTEEDSDKIYHNLASANEISIDLFNIFQKKVLFSFDPGAL